MANWVRLWEDMPTDPKWRVVAKRAGRPISEVMAVFMFMMTNAGANATERGVLSNWSDEDVAAALDSEVEHVKAIREAMQGKTLEGGKLSGWEKRQPKREDGASERAKQWRERNRTQPNASKRPEADAETDAEKNAALLCSDEQSSSSNAPPPLEISDDEIERRCEEATGWRELRNIASISKLIASGVSFEDRILPICRTVSAERKATGQGPPKSWAFVVEAAKDETRQATPAARTVETVFVREGSPEWEALCAIKKPSLLRAMLNGKPGIYWPAADFAANVPRETGGVM